jgi:hypothetical protein
MNSTLCYPSLSSERDTISQIAPRSNLNTLVPSIQVHVPHLFRVLSMQMLGPWLRYGQLLKDVMGLNKQGTVNGRVVTSAKKASMYPSWASTVTATSSGPVSSSSLCAWIGRNAKKRSKWVLHYEALISSDKSCAQQRKHDCVYSQLWGLLICPWSFWGLAYNPTDSFKERIVPKKAPNS